MTSSTDSADRRALLQEEEEAAHTERRRLIVARMRNHAARTMGLAAADMLDPNQPLSDLGLDSLVSVELLIWVEAEFGVSLPVGCVLEGPSIAELAAQVDRLQQISTVASANDSTAGAATQPRNSATTDELERTAQLLANVDNMPAEQVDALLAELLLTETPTQ